MLLLRRLLPRLCRTCEKKGAHLLSQTCSSKKCGCCFPINKPCFNLKKHDLDLWEKQRFANICPLKTKSTKLKTCQVIGVTRWMLEYKSMKNLGFSTLGAANSKKWDLIFLDVFVHSQEL